MEATAHTNLHEVYTEPEIIVNPTPPATETVNDPFPPQPETNINSNINTILNNNPELLLAVNNLVEGRFEYIKFDDRIMYTTAWQAITQTELWNFMRNFTGGSFMFSRDERVGRIYGKIEELGYGGHSCGSFGSIMRVMEYIANHGEQQFMLEYIQDANL